MQRSRRGTRDASGQLMHAMQYLVSPTAEGHFAWLRTRYAIDRTFMAWLRTAASMIAFGFTIVQFFEHLVDVKGFAAPRLPHAPVFLGLALVGTGVIALTTALYEYTAVVRHLEDHQFDEIADERPHKGATIVVGIAVIVTGIVAFTSILVRSLL